MADQKKQSQMRKERMEQILRETKYAALEEGIGSHLMTDVAKRCGITRQRLYQYYPNAEKMLEATERDCSYRMRQMSGINHIEEVCDEKAFIEFMTEPTMMNADAMDDFLFLEVYEVYKTYRRKVSGARVEDVRGNYNTLFSKWVEKMQKDGIFRDDLSPRDLDHVVTQVIRGVNYRAMVIQRNQPCDTLLQDKEVRRWMAESLWNFLSDRRE